MEPKVVVSPSRVDGAIARVVQADDMGVVELWDGKSWVRDPDSPITVRDVLVAPPAPDPSPLVH